MVFPTFFNLSLNLAVMSSWSEPQSAPGLVFADHYWHIHLCLRPPKILSTTCKISTILWRNTWRERNYNSSGDAWRCTCMQTAFIAKLLGYPESLGPRNGSSWRLCLLFQKSKEEVQLTRWWKVPHSARWLLKTSTPHNLQPSHSPHRMLETKSEGYGSPG